MLASPRVERRLAALRRRVLSFSFSFRSVSLSRRAWRRVFQIAVFLVLFPPLLQWTIAYLVGGDVRLLPQELQGAKNLLIVTAHPDDECLFFAPSILGVLDRNRGVHGSLISMSTGNNYGIGDLRKTELIGSCAALQIDPARCMALDHPELQDNPTVWWDTALVRKTVQEYIDKWNIDTIITFDEGGVSGHINHRAVSAAIRELVLSSSPPSRTPVAYMVVTTPLWRKYTFLGDLPLTALRFTWRILAALFYPAREGSTRTSAMATSRALVANSWHRYQKTREAFRNHNSQYTWDRHLYMIISRYVWFNDLKKVVPTAGSA